MRNRLPLDALDYEIPRVATRLPYFLGALTLTSLVLSGATGLYLSQLYQPAPVGAHASVIYIVERAPLGDLSRSLHWWSANGAVLAVLLHLSWVFYRGSYRAPRELTWWTGAGMLGCVFLLFFTGTTLPYDQAGYEALSHNVAAAARWGPLGRFMTDEFTPSAPLLARMYALHVSVLPIALLTLLALHLFLIRSLGIHTRANEAGSGVLFRDHLKRLGAYGSWLAALLLGLSLLVPRDLGHVAVPGVEVTKPPVPFLWIVAIENELGIGALAVIVPAAFLALVLVPLVDRRLTDSLRGLRVRVFLVVLVWAALVALTIVAWIAPQQQHLGM